MLGTIVTTLDGRTINTVVDTGARSSMTSKEFAFYAVNHKFGTLYNCKNIVATGANGSTMTAKETCFITYMLASKKLTFQFYVVPDLVVDLLFGLDFTLF